MNRKQNAIICTMFILIFILIVLRILFTYYAPLFQEKRHNVRFQSVLIDEKNDYIYYSSSFDTLNRQFLYDASNILNELPKTIPYDINNTTFDTPLFAPNSEDLEQTEIAEMTEFDEETAESNNQNQLLNNGDGVSNSKQVDSKALQTDSSKKTTKQPEPENNKVDIQPPSKKEEPSIQDWDQPLNQYVLDVIKTYSNGRYPYVLNEDYENYNGVTSNIYYKDKLLLKAHPSGNRASHCVGLTFEVFFKAMQERNKKLGLALDDFNGMTWNELHEFVLIWFVAYKPKEYNNLAVAIEKYGLGTRITRLEDAKAGDFVDFSRVNNTGHAVILINWVWENNKIVGIRYWSSQPNTNGINYNTEYFNLPRPDGRRYGIVNINDIYIGRVNPVKNYR